MSCHIMFTLEPKMCTKLILLSISRDISIEIQNAVL